MFGASSFGLAAMALLTLCVADVSIQRLKCSEFGESFVCNNGTAFRCVCHGQAAAAAADRPDQPRDCRLLLTDRSTQTLRLTLADLGPPERLALQLVDLKGNNVTYDYYLRWRIANIVGNFCLDDAARCLRIGLLIDANRVVILGVNCDSAGRTVIDYVVTTSAYSKDLSGGNVANQTLVLRALRLKLNKTLPHTIANHTLHIVHNPAAYDYFFSTFYQNFSLIVALIAIAVVLLIIYIVAIVKLINDRCRKRPRAKAADATVIRNDSPTCQYGSLDQRPEALEKPVGKRWDNNANGFTPTDVTAEANCSNGKYAMQNKSSSDHHILEQQQERQRDQRHLPRASDRRPPPIFPISKSLQLKSEKNLPRNKAKTYCAFDRHADRVLIDRNIVDAVEESAFYQNPAISPEGSTVIKVPVLIVPAMSSTTRLDEFDKEPSVQNDESKRSYRRPYNRDAELTTAISEENLLGYTEARRSPAQIDDRLSVSSSDTANSEEEDEDEQTKLNPAVDYKPLCESSWSVNRIDDDEDLR